MQRSDARRRVAEALDRLGVLGPVARVRERIVAWRAPATVDVGPDGLPMPPVRLRVSVDGHGRPDGFVEDGEAAVRMVRELLASADVRPEGLTAILDFGCGCGRVARHWAGLSGPEIHGCDYNPELLAWCDDNLPFMTTARNGLEPPLPYDDARFDLVYAISVFTHLTAPLQLAWMRELTRILRPGGLLLFTTHGDTYRSRLTPAERPHYDAGEIVVQRPRVAGSNACAAYHPPAHVAGPMLGDLELRASREGGPNASFQQDAWLAQRNRERPTGRSRV